MLCYYVTADSCSYIFWNLLSAAFPCLQPIRGWRVALRQTWWKTIKLCTSQIEDEGAESIDQGDHAEEALQRLVNCFARACNEFGLTISLQKDQHHGPKRQPHPQHLHRWLHSRGGWHFHLPGSHHCQQPLFRRWAELKDRQDSNGDGSSGQKCLEQLHADHQHQDEGLSSVRAQYTSAMAAKHGPCNPVKSADLMPSTCVVSVGSWASPGKIVFQTRTFWHKQEYSVCLPCSARDACAGLVM